MLEKGVFSNHFHNNNINKKCNDSSQGQIRISDKKCTLNWKIFKMFAFFLLKLYQWGLKLKRPVYVCVYVCYWVWIELPWKTELLYDYMLYKQTKQGPQESHIDGKTIKSLYNSRLNIRSMEEN